MAEVTEVIKRQRRNDQRCTDACTVYAKSKTIEIKEVGDVRRKKRMKNTDEGRERERERLRENLRQGEGAKEEET